ncbi:hypothetical protein DP090_016340 [Pseudomonas sp. MDMC216]|jgi:hypothetical protein|nr:MULTISPECIES: hypothetical protein [Pseudomonas]MDP3367912.1 hypothetical protein [Pseudomonas sp.]MDH1561119.1 hypothetical protein [Pseudomonas chengduensis]MDH1620175.1 hypothetical protein [Pseudomonas chengduensis]MDH1865787.1 hypothetical protein [Pseudomonas chengduensis]MDI5994581.1 hypothetical protein [Pseudomonas sp. MDMC216]
MRIPILAAMILVSSLATLTWAQQPMRMPSAPEAGSPGTATPQPYGQPSTAVPIKRQGAAPLLPPPQGQPLPGATPRSNSDQPIPQLDEQIRRNSQELDGRRKQD